MEIVNIAEKIMMKNSNNTQTYKIKNRIQKQNLIFQKHLKMILKTLTIIKIKERKKRKKELKPKSQRLRKNIQDRCYKKKEMDMVIIYKILVYLYLNILIGIEVHT